MNSQKVTMNSSVLILMFCFIISFINCVPFVTKRVSLHNPINIDFSGWIPLRPKPEDQMIEGMSESQIRPEMVHNLDNHFLTVPVAVETDIDKQLSTMDLNHISRQVLQNWNQKQYQNHDSFPPFPAQLIDKLRPKPEIELLTGKEEQQIREEQQLENETEYTFVKMDTKKKTTINTTDSSEENLFHAYFAPKEHIPPEGYIKLSKNEFKQLFKNADILFV